MIDEVRPAAKYAPSFLRRSVVMTCIHAQPHGLPERTVLLREVRTRWRAYLAEEIEGRPADALIRLSFPRERRPRIYRSPAIAIASSSAPVSSAGLQWCRRCERRLSQEWAPLRGCWSCHLRVYPCRDALDAHDTCNDPRSAWLSEGCRVPSSVLRKRSYSQLPT